MAYIVATSSQFRTPSGYLSDSANSSFPNTNVGLYRYPNRPWKGTTLTSGTSYIGANLGSALTNAAIIVDNINVASVKVQAASNSAFSTSVQEATVTVSQNPVNGRYCLYYDSSAFTAKQYWRVLANTSTATDGASVMKCGSLIFCSSVTTWPGGSGEYGEQPIQAVRPNEDFAGGGAEPVILGNKYGAITLGQSPASRADMRSTLLSLLREGIGTYFAFYKNDSDTSEVYVVRRAADVTVRQTTPTAIEYSGLILQNAV